MLISDANPDPLLSGYVCVKRTGVNALIESNLIVFYLMPKLDRMYNSV